MNEERKKIEKIEKAEPTRQEVTPAELSEQEMDQAAGGSRFTIANKKGGSNPL
jgi:hypothetical protein